MEPPQDLAFCDGLSPQARRVADTAVCQTAAKLGKRGGYLIVAEPRTPVGMLHRRRPGQPQNLGVHHQRGPQRRTGIARGGLNEDIIKRTVFQHLAVHNAVQAHPACNAQVRLASRCVKVVGHVQADLFRDPLQRGCNVLVALLNRLPALAWRAEDLSEGV